MARSSEETSALPFIRPFQAFFRTEAASGVLLLALAVVALLWANSPWASAYFSLWDTLVTVSIGSAAISKPLLLWVNDGLMAIFFFLVGLEIKREILVGELSSPRQAALPLLAAVGGMVVPAGLYALVAGSTDYAAGWGIPMATDIAFALGVLALLGTRAPVALKIFLTALAIVDDLGAVLVIAFFYTSKLSVAALGVAAVFLALLVAANRLGIQRTAVYVILGLGLWVAVLKSGVHATIAGVLLALTIPARGEHSLLLRMEHKLHGWVAFGIMPVFALANAGVALGGVSFTEAILHPAAFGILLGLFVGKQIGVFAFSWLSIRMGWAVLPSGTTWTQLYGVALLTGIGFTMSLFIANLSFVGLPEAAPGAPAALDLAKIGILTASLLSGVVGYVMLRRLGASNA